MESTGQPPSDAGGGAARQQPPSPTQPHAATSGRPQRRRTPVAPHTHTIERRGSVSSEAHAYAQIQSEAHPYAHESTARELPQLGRKVNYTFFLLSVQHLFGERYFAFQSYDEALQAYGGNHDLLQTRMDRGVLEWRNGLLCWATGRGKLKEATKWGLEHFLRRLGWQDSALRPTPHAYDTYWKGFYEKQAWLYAQGTLDFVRAHGHPVNLAPTPDGDFPDTGFQMGSPSSTDTDLQASPEMGAHTPTHTHTPTHAYANNPTHAHPLSPARTYLEIHQPSREQLLDFIHRHTHPQQQEPPHTQPQTQTHTCAHAHTHTGVSHAHVDYAHTHTHTHALTDVYVPYAVTVEASAVPLSPPPLLPPQQHTHAHIHTHNQHQHQQHQHQHQHQQHQQGGPWQGDSAEHLRPDSATDQALDAITTSWYGVDFHTFATDKG